jgi:hypothetical protein
VTATHDSIAEVSRRRVTAVAMVGTWLLCNAAVLLGTFATPHRPGLPSYQVAAAWVLFVLRVPWFWLHALLCRIIGWTAATIFVLLFLGVLWALVVNVVLDFLFGRSDRRKRSTGRGGTVMLCTMADDGHSPEANGEIPGQGIADEQEHYG